MELSGFPHEILSSIWKVFFSTPRISSIWKINSITVYLLFEKWFESPSLNQKSLKKKTWFLNSFSPTPPRTRECQSTSGRVPLREVLWHSPLRGVTQVRASMFYWFEIISLQKNTKNGSGTKDFQIEDIPKIIPMLKGLFLDFWSFELLLHSAISSIWNAFGRTPRKHLLFEKNPGYLL